MASAERLKRPFVPNELVASYRGFSPCREVGFSWAKARVLFASDALELMQF